MKSCPSDIVTSVPSQSGSCCSPVSVRRVRSWLRSHSLQLLVALLLAYALAVLWPEPGILLKSLHVPGLIPGAPVTMPQLVLGCLLLCAGLTVETTAVPRIQIRSLLAFTSASLLIPLCVTGCAVTLGSGIGIPSGILLGLIVIAAMPVANSSIGWTHLAGGNLPLGLGLLLAGTLVSPIVSPLILMLLAPGVSAEPSSIQELISLRELSEFLGVWVLLPAMLGLAIGIVSRRKGVVWSAHWLRIVSITCLLLLNYMNAASALPFIQVRTVLALGLLTTLAVNLCTLTVTWLLALILKVRHEDRVALCLAVAMRNTGAALVLSGLHLQSDPNLVMTVLLHTVLQHLVAGGFVSLVEQHGPGTDSSRSSPASTSMSSCDSSV